MFHMTVGLWPLRFGWQNHAETYCKKIRHVTVCDIKALDRIWRSARAPQYPACSKKKAESASTRL
jgi:hypothetical protein